jgi:hypothetical protein
MHRLLFLLTTLCWLRPPAAVARPTEARLVVKAPFEELTGGVVLLQAQVAGYAIPLNFILDTGSGGISLDSTLVAQWRIPAALSEVTLQGIGGNHALYFTPLLPLVINQVLIDSFSFHIRNYKVLSDYFGVPVHGIIGYSLLKKYIAAVDFDSLQLSIYKPGRYDYPERGFTIATWHNPLPHIPSVVRNSRKVNTNLLLDSGAGLYTLFSSLFLKDSALLTNANKPKLSATVGSSGKDLLKITTIKSLKFGPYVFRNIPACIYEDSSNLLGYPDNTGLIGNDLLRRFNVVINYPERKFHFTPNHYFFESFDYSYTGLNLTKEDGRIYINDIVPGSPAEQCGLHNGDVIYAIGNNTSPDLTRMYKAMQQEGKRIKLVVQREEELLEVYLTVGSIR